MLHDDKTRAYQSAQRLCLAMVDVEALRQHLPLLSFRF
ncbi:hypothetical protein APA_4641 [Pseudanabaena sp. lw0831]|nr:hypothetical protein APA_4641 [Pseudanabaena sp. lw0831]